MPREKTARGEKTPLAPSERRAVLALIGVCALVTFFWAAYDQQGNTLVLWAEDFTDRSIDLYFWKGEIPSSWFLALNPLMIFLFTPAIALWLYLRHRARQRLQSDDDTHVAFGFVARRARRIPP